MSFALVIVFSLREVSNDSYTMSAYNVTSSRFYPYRRENARSFSQELIEYVLFDFGHVWKAERSRQECRLRDDALYTFTPRIGRLVAYISRKYGGYIVMKCFSNWKFINSHREFMRPRMLCNEIGNFCNRSDLDTDDLGLFAFLAMTVEYARLAITNGQEHLIQNVVDALSHCMTDSIHGGFLITLARLQKRAKNFEYPRAFVVQNHDQGRPLARSVSIDSVFTTRSEGESPLFQEDSFPSTSYDTPMEEVEEEYKKRELHREICRRQMMSDISTQVELKDDRSSLLESTVMRSPETEVVMKTEIIKDYSSNEYILEGRNVLVERHDVCIQTSTPTEKLRCDDLKDKYSSRCSEITSVDSRFIDLKAVIDKLNDIQNFRIEDGHWSKNYAPSTDIDNTHLEHESKDCSAQSEAGSLHHSKLDLDLEDENPKDLNSVAGNGSMKDGCSSHENSDLSKDLKLEGDPSCEENCVKESFDDSLPERIDKSFEPHPPNNEEDILPGTIDESYESQLESLMERINVRSEGSLSEN